MGESGVGEGSWREAGELESRGCRGTRLAELAVDSTCTEAGSALAPAEDECRGRRLERSALEGCRRSCSFALDARGEGLRKSTCAGDWASVDRTGRNCRREDLGSGTELGGKGCGTARRKEGRWCTGTEDGWPSGPRAGAVARVVARVPTFPSLEPTPAASAAAGRSPTPIASRRPAILATEAEGVESVPTGP